MRTSRRSISQLVVCLALALVGGSRANATEVLLPVNCERTTSFDGTPGRICAFGNVFVRQNEPLPGAILYTSAEVDRLLHEARSSASADVVAANARIAELEKKSADLSAALNNLLALLDQLPDTLAANPALTEELLKQLMQKLDARGPTDAGQ